MKAKLEGKLTENNSNSSSNKPNKSNIILPIFYAKDDILRHIEDNQTVLISGMCMYIHTLIKFCYYVYVIYVTMYIHYTVYECRLHVYVFCHGIAYPYQLYTHIHVYHTFAYTY